MSASSSRLLILGAAQIFQPVNGYQIRRELLSWGVDTWAHINPGSIYSVLGTLTRQGLVERHDVDDAGRTVAVYTVTPAGRDEFSALMEKAVTTVDIAEPLLLHTALAMLPHVDRSTVLGWMRTRIAELEDTLDRTGGGGDAGTPPHVRGLVDLWRSVARTELEWFTGLVARIEGGELSFAGEGFDWAPPPGDPGWQMVEERERYRAILGLG